MKFKISVKKEDREVAREILDSFCDKAEKEYEEQVLGKDSKVPSVAKTKIPVSMTPVLEDDGNNFFIVVPFDIPKGFGMLFFPVKRKMTRMLEKYLKEKGLKASVKYVGN